MKTDQTNLNKGSVLIIALLTITILTMICATSLYISSQNTSTGVQTAAWQQSLTGAEIGIDAAIRALNQNATTGANAWTNWKTVNGALPTPVPSGSPVPGFTSEPTGGNAIASGAAPPDSSHYYYLPSSAQQASVSYPSSEGTTSVSTWVTIDTAGGLSNSNGSFYRIRATGQATFQSNSVYKRVSNNRLDNDLRNTISMNSNRKGGSNLGPSRTIEVIVQPVPKGGGGLALTLANWLQMTGGGTVDAFNSPNGQWSSTYRDPSNPLLVAEGATGNQAGFANTGQTYVYGGVVYSGTPPTNINASGPPKDVLGQVSTPDNVTVPPTSDPTVSGSNYNWTYQNPWAGTTTNYTWSQFGGANSGGTYAPSAGTYGTLTGGGNPPAYNGTTITTITANGTAASPALIIINNDFTIGGGKTLLINGSGYVTIWVKGKFTTSGSGLITQGSGAHVTWIVDNDITVSGDSYSNQNGFAATDNFVGVGNHKFTDSGSGTFTGTVHAPGYDGTISGSGDYTGSFLGSTMTISGGGSFHYDESLTPGNTNPLVGNYAFVSWFEDNSDPTRKDANGNYIVY